MQCKNTKKYRTPTLDCQEYKQIYECNINDDMLPRVTPLNGGCFTNDNKLIGVPTFEPTEEPTTEL